MSTELPQVTRRLCEISERAFLNPHTAVEWPASISEDAWYMSPELLSIYGTKTWEGLSDAQQKRVALFECGNFFSLNINGEKSLIEGLSRRLYPLKKSVGVDVSAYIHHFLDEENKHMLYFGTFCQKYLGKTYPEKKVPFTREHTDGEEDLLFFLKVMIFEEIVDVFNLRMSKDDRLEPVARRINYLHHQDETRHLVFGRLVVKELWEQYSPSWSDAQRAAIREYAEAYFKATWKEYYNPDVYKDAGLTNSYAVYKEALASEHGRELRARVSDKCVKYLLEIGILTEVPSL
jgi:hypothetical protein